MHTNLRKQCPGGRSLGRENPSSSLYREAMPERGTPFFRLQVCERVGISLGLKWGYMSLQCVKDSCEKKKQQKKQGNLKSWFSDIFML